MKKKKMSGGFVTPTVPVLVMGVGNILCGDDGIGIHIIRDLQKLTLPGNIELLDGGTASLSFLDNISNREKVIIIDAVKANNEPGTIYRFTPDDINVKSDLASSLHTIGIIESLTLFELMGSRPKEVVFFGIEPEIIEWGMALSAKVESAIPELLKMIYKELKITANE